MSSEVGQYSADGVWTGAPQETKVISIEPMIRIEFSRYGAYASRYWPNGKTEEIAVETAMKAFDESAAAGNYDR